MFSSITNNSIKHQSFVYTQLNDQTDQFNTSHLFAHSLNVKYFYLTHTYNPIRCYYSKSEWTWEQWQCWGTRHSPKLQHYWSLKAIRLFSVITRTLIGRGYPSVEMKLVYSTALGNRAVMY